MLRNRDVYDAGEVVQARAVSDRGRQRVPAMMILRVGRSTARQFLRSGVGRVLVAAVGLMLAAGTARANVVWLCHPGTTADPCEMPLDMTVIHPDGTRSVTTPARVSGGRRALDCFYVYPTVSNQIGLNATKAKDPEIVAVTQDQAARFSSLCRMFVPLYREVTVADVAGNGIPGGPIDTAYADVLEAWRAYLANDNDGRGVILIGHSQGSLLLRELIRTQIDPNPSVRRLLAGAFLLGGNVTVRAGQASGGDFQSVPLCTVLGQFGCVVAYSTFSTDPLPGISFFGNTDTDLLSVAFGEPHGAGYEVACTDPGPLSGASGPFSIALPIQPFPPGFIAGGIAATAGGNIPTAPTTWIEGYEYSGSCRTINGAHVFRYDPVRSSPKLNEFPPAWGTHLVDFNLGLSRLVTIAGDEAQSWLNNGFVVGPSRDNKRAGTAKLRVTVPGAGTVTLNAPGNIHARTVTVTQPQTLLLPVIPTSRVKRQLKARHSRQVTVTISYEPGGGTKITRPKRIHLALS
jgi:pimeloyl-ACP methyl ester carboxylesterase